MKVIIITEAGKTIGFGHLTRCISLYQAFEEKEIIPEFVIMGDKRVENLLRNKKYTAFDWLKNQEGLFDFIKDADIVIVDSYLADISFYRDVSALAKIPVYIDDNNRIDYPKGIVINGALYAQDINYIKKEDVVYLVGPQYVPLRKEFWEVREKEIKEKVQNIMITFGGDDEKNMTPKILDFLTEYYPMFEKNVIIGMGFENINEIQGKVDKKTNLIYYPDGHRMKEIMLESDITISGGGQSLYELARVGVPTLGICIADNQLKNVEAWEKAGFLEYVGWYNHKNLLENIRNSMEHLENIDTRRRRSELGRRYIDGKGSLRVIKLPLSNWFKDNLYLRSAGLEDAVDIFNLSNDEMVRSNSFEPERIEWESHLNWLRRKLSDTNCVFFIVTGSSGKFYGQVRFEMESEAEKAIINISLVKNIRGLGLSSFLIEKSIIELLRIHKGVRLIRAFIKEKNVLSIKAFEKANFRFSEDLTIKGNKSKIYVRETGNAKIQYR